MLPSLVAVVVRLMRALNSFPVNRPIFRLIWLESGITIEVEMDNQRATLHRRKKLNLGDDKLKLGPGSPAIEVL